MIGYPNGKSNPANKEKTSASNRGMSLEYDLNLTNQYYLDLDIAVIHKKPTPIQIVSVDYPKRTAAKITEAYFKIPSTTDYNGIYKGKAIDFEAKAISSKTAFPFNVIHKHQIEHLKKVRKHGGICFLIIRFNYYDETYLVDGQLIINAYETRERASLPYKWFKENGHPIPYSLTPPVDYLKIIDKIY